MNKDTQKRAVELYKAHIRPNITQISASALVVLAVTFNLNSGGQDNNYIASAPNTETSQKAINAAIGNKKITTNFRDHASFKKTKVQPTIEPQNSPESEKEYQIELSDNLAVKFTNEKEYQTFLGSQNNFIAKNKTYKNSRKKTVTVPDQILKALHYTGKLFEGYEMGISDVKLLGGESGFNTTASPKTSSAYGLAQFTTGTTLETVYKLRKVRNAPPIPNSDIIKKKYVTSNGEKKERYYVKSDLTGQDYKKYKQEKAREVHEDPVISTIMYAAFNIKNSSSFQKHHPDIEQTLSTKNLSYVMGNGDRRKLINSTSTNPNQPAYVTLMKHSRVNIDKLLYKNGNKETPRSLKQAQEKLSSYPIYVSKTETGHNLLKANDILYINGDKNTPRDIQQLEKFTQIYKPLNSAPAIANLSIFFVNKDINKPRTALDIIKFFKVNKGMDDTPVNIPTKMNINPNLELVNIKPEENPPVQRISYKSKVNEPTI